MWTKTSDDTAVHILLVVISLVIGLIVFFRVRRIAALSGPVRTGIGIGIAVIAVGVAVWTTTFELAEGTVKEFPTMLFGLGAIMLAREPRGVLYDMVNRQRLRQLEDIERREEEAALATELAGANR
jgi:hypothetical protein